MKNKIKKTFLFAVTFTAIAFWGCKKDNDTNFQPIGNYGNADVQSSTFTNQTLVYNPSVNGYLDTLSDPAITQAVLTNGSITVYQQFTNATNVWYVLPATWQPEVFTVSFVIGKAVVACTVDPGISNYRVVIISAARKQANQNVNYTNYEEVKKAFHLKD